MDNLNEMVEALLFSSGKAMQVDQLATITNSSTTKIKNALKKLQQEYEQKKGALMVIEEDKAWKLSVREGYLPLVRKIVADTELPKSYIETLAVIAWRAPVTQSSVIRIRTNKAYEHISELERLGFLIKEKYGRTFKLKLTDKFFDYFDISGNKDIREMFRNVKGIEQDLEEEQDKKKHPEEAEESEAETDVKEVEEVVEEIDKEEKEEEIIESEIGTVEPENPEKEKKEVYSEKEVLEEMGKKEEP